MKNRFVVRVALLLALMGVVCGLSPLTVQASAELKPTITLMNVPRKDANLVGTGNIKAAVLAINKELSDEHGWVDKSVTPNRNINFITYAFDNGIVTLTIDMPRYRKLDNKVQQETMQVALDGIYNSDISRTFKNKIYNELCALDSTTAALVRELSNDVRADFIGAYSWFRPFSGPIGWLLGVISLAMFTVLGLTMVVDISYVTLPIVQSVLNKENANKATFVSYEAYHAVKEQQAKAGVEYVSPMGIYLRLKVKQLVAIFICLLYLVSGELYVLLGNMMDYFRGILG